MELIFATRPSALARWQTNHIMMQLSAAWPGLVCKQQLFTTQGDRVLDKPLPEVGGKGLFTYELEQALRAGHVDAAVHSLKDLPTEQTQGLDIGVITHRADPRDALISPAGYKLDELPRGAIVGTSSNRRKAQLLAYRPDLQIASVRGNVDTRLRKTQEGQYDAIVLAAAGLERLGLEKQISQYLSFEIMLPAPGQGALAVQCRADDETTQIYLHALDHLPTRLAVTSERAFLATLGGGCSLPVGAFAQLDGTQIHLQISVALPEKNRLLRLQSTGEDPSELGTELARQALAQGARELLG